MCHFIYIYKINVGKQPTKTAPFNLNRMILSFPHKLQIIPSALCFTATRYDTFPCYLDDSVSIKIQLTKNLRQIPSHLANVLTMCDCLRLDLNRVMTVKSN